MKIINMYESINELQDGIVNIELMSYENNIDDDYVKSVDVKIIPFVVKLEDKVVYCDTITISRWKRHFHDIPKGTIEYQFWNDWDGEICECNPEMIKKIHLYFGKVTV